MAVPECRMSGRHCRGVLRDIQRPVGQQVPQGTAGVSLSPPQDAGSPCSLLKLQISNNPPSFPPPSPPRVDIISSRRDVHDKTEGNLDSYAISTYKVVTQGSLWSLCSAGLSLQVCFQKSTQDVGAFVFLSVMLQLRRSRSLFSK